MSMLMPVPLPVRLDGAPAVGAGWFVLGIGTAGLGRDGARQAVRLALRRALADLWKVAPQRLEICSAPGSAPRLARDGAVLAGPGLSISHDEGCSLAAVNLDGAIGVDVMRAQELPDWHAVARDYLGPAQAAALARLAPPHRACAFAQAWSAREADLKCHGLALAEWGAPAACRRIALALPDGWCGTLALPA